MDVINTRRHECRDGSTRYDIVVNDNGDITYTESWYVDDQDVWAYNVDLITTFPEQDHDEDVDDFVEGYIRQREH